MKIPNKIESIFEITFNSVQFLAWTSPIVAALLALTTIVFSQYNERLLNTSNNINKEIKKILIHNSTTEETVPEKINNLMFILQGKTLYSMNLAFFTLVSLLSSLAWLISGVGYFINQPEPSFGDNLIIILSILIVTFTFLGLPVLLIIFNKKTVITLDFRNRLSYKKLAKYLKSLSSHINDEKILMDYVQPSLQITLDYSKKISFQFKQEISITEVFFVFEFRGQNFESQIIKIKNNSNDNYISYELSPSTNTNYSYEGLYEKINSSENLNLYVFSGDKASLLATYRLQKEIVQSSQSCTFYIDNKYRLSENESITNLLNSKSNIHLKEGIKITEFLFQQKKN